MNVSPNFSPSIKLMKPYFLFAGFFYALSFGWLFFIEPFAGFHDFKLIGWVHLYMLGFVMLAIFSAMAQLGPVVVEVKHHNVNVFKYIWIILLAGLVSLLTGFYTNVTFLLTGGILTLFAMSLYAIEFLKTLKSAQRETSITNAMKMSNFFLLVGIVNGLLMALAFNGILDIDPHTFLKAHTFGLIAGFVIMLIMGISIILIPMFGLAKRISDNEFAKSFFAITLSVVLMLLSPFFLTSTLEHLAYFITIIAILLYLHQLYKMVSSRTKIIHDIWAKSMYVGFSSFIISFLLLSSYVFNENELILKLGIWILFVGFFGFLIIGNYYKIIPFLVWFQIYSPLIEERAVPMLHELLPKKLVSLQWAYSSLGLIVSSLGLFMQSSKVFYGGVTFLLIGAMIFFIVINKILKPDL